LVDFEQGLFKNTFPEFGKKKRSCVIFRNKNLTTKMRIFENKILNLLMDWANKPKNTLEDFV
jgi:hypothetical protein